MKPFYRLIMRAGDCVGVVAGANGEATIVIEVSGGTAAVNRMLDKIPGEAATSDEWIEDLLDLLPVTYKIGPVEDVKGDAADVSTSDDLADALAEANISSASRSSKLVTTRVAATATINDGGAADAGSSHEGKLKKRAGDDDEVGQQPAKLHGDPLEDEPTDATESEDELAAESESSEDAKTDVAEPAGDGSLTDEPAADEPDPEPESELEPEPEPEVEPTPPPMVMIEADPNRPVLSVADDGAGLMRQWFLLLEDWQGFAAVFAGDRDSYAVLARAATEDMSRQIAQAVPREAANLEHWVTSLIRKLPAGVWLRSFSNVRSLSEADLNTPEEMLRAVVDFYGTPSPNRQAEFYGVGAVDGSLVIDEKAGAFQTAVVDGVQPS